MKRHSLWILLFVLAGCTANNGGESPEAICRRQAYDDPAVKLLTIKSLGQPANTPQSQFDYEMALRKATDACLRQKGVQVRGGVEPVQPH